MFLGTPVMPELSSLINTGKFGTCNYYSLQALNNLAFSFEQFQAST